MSYFKSVVLVGAAVLLPGCYRYVDVQPAAISVPADIRVEVVPPGRVSLQSDTGSLGFSNVRWLRGRMTASEGDTLVLRNAKLTVPGFPRERGIRGESRYVPEPAHRLRVRKLDGVRTTLAVVIPAAFVAIVISGLQDMTYSIGGTQ
jgi:hypothetical protein